MPTETNTAAATLNNYRTGETIRAATPEEVEASADAAERDGGAGVKTAEFAAEFQTFCAHRENGLLAVEVSLSSIGRWILESGADMDELCAILSEEQTDLVNSALAAV